MKQEYVYNSDLKKNHKIKVNQEKKIQIKSSCS